MWAPERDRVRVDVAGEVAQPLEAAKRWHKTQLATRSYGQGVAVTPIEMVAAANAIANGGESPIPFDELLETSAVALRVQDLMLGRDEAPE